MISTNEVKSKKQHLCFPVRCATSSLSSTPWSLQSLGSLIGPPRRPRPCSCHNHTNVACHATCECPFSARGSYSTRMARAQSWRWGFASGGVASDLGSRTASFARAQGSTRARRLAAALGAPGSARRDSSPARKRSPLPRWLVLRRPLGRTIARQPARRRSVGPTARTATAIGTSPRSSTAASRSSSRTARRCRLRRSSHGRVSPCVWACATCVICTSYCAT